MISDRLTGRCERQAIERDEKMKNISERKSRFALLGVVVLGLMTFSGAFGLFVRAQRVSWKAPFAAYSATSEQVVISIEGMHCSSCASGIKATLKRTLGVISVDVSYPKKEAVVNYDSQKTTPAKIVEAINNLGYKASVKNKT